MNNKFYSPSIMLMKLVYLSLGIYFMLTLEASYWFYPILGYVFLAMCNGAVAHKYFVHGQYKVNQAGRYLLGAMATVGAYSPLSYWIIQHRHHHRHSDKETDVHSPVHGFFHALFLWPFKESSIQIVFKDTASKILLVKCHKDKMINFLSRYFLVINLCFIALLGMIDWKVLCYAYFAGYVLEYLRLGLINSLCHMKLPGSYRNFETNDNSYNNYLIGIITLGFSWHNNHHADAGRLDMRVKWWEFDIESMFARLMAKVFQ